MTDWVCPACHLSVRAVAVEVGHQCPAKRSRWVAFRRVDELEAKGFDRTENRHAWWIGLGLLDENRPTGATL